MIERALAFVKEHGKALEDQFDYVKGLDWSSALSTKARESNYEFASGILKSAFKKLEFVYSEAGDERLKNKRLKKFAESINEFAKSFLAISRVYLESEDWKDYGNNLDEEEDIEKINKKRQAEIEFHDTIISDIIAIEETLKKLNTDNSEQQFSIPIHGDSVLSVPMMQFVKEMYGGIDEYLEYKRKKELETSDLDDEV